MQRISADINDIRRTVGLILEPGGVVELRAPKTERDGVISGYFSDPEKLAQAAREVSGRAPGVYFTLNRIPVDLLARADNRYKSRAQVTTTDGEISRRLWLLLDFDPTRPAGISSTDAEHEASLQTARTAMEGLELLGWPKPVFADSGNGAHLLYRIDLPNDPEAATLVKAVLGAIKQRHNSRSVTVDQAVFNASRISKVYGTVAQKGDSTPDRPHRLSKLLSVPATLVAVSVEQLQALAAEVRIESPPPAAPATSRSRPHSALPAFRLEDFFMRHGIQIRVGPVMDQGSEKWVLDHCPFNPAHAGKDAAVFRKPSGALAFKCLHDSCSEKDWKAFREFFDGPKPAYHPRGPQRVERSAPQPLPDAPESDKRDEIPGSVADVEAAAAAAIASNDVVMAMGLAPAMSALRPHLRNVIIAKLQEHFKKRFSAKAFKESMKDAAAGSAPPPHEDESDDEAFEDGPNLLAFPLTDAGNGERIVSLFGKDVHYCVEMKRWLIWDGMRWGVDELNSMRQKAKAMARMLYRQAKDAGLNLIESHARASESYAAITAALGSAATEAGVPISAAELDQHPYLLNCPNGVVDLRSGQILKHNRDFLITKLCPVPYQPDAKCPRFVSFVEWAMGANPEAEITQRTTRLVGFLQRAFGYA